MFRVKNIRKTSQISGIRTHHTVKTSPTLQKGSVVEIQKITFQT